MRTLIIIPARAGSKGLPGKNIKLLGGKALIAYSIEYAIEIKGENDIICISSNDDDVLKIAEQYDISIPFKRPEELASDTAGSYEVIMHAINYYEQKGILFERILLLQPTSPFRTIDDFTRLQNQYDNCDMAVTVSQAKENPYFNIFEENNDGYLEKSKKGNFATRQECPPVYVYNGSMYLISIQSLKQGSISSFKKIRKVVMPYERSVDIDTMKDWIIAEYFSSLTK